MRSAIGTVVLLSSLFAAEARGATWIEDAEWGDFKQRYGVGFGGGVVHSSNSNTRASYFSLEIQALHRLDGRLMLGGMGIISGGGGKLGEVGILAAAGPGIATVIPLSSTFRFVPQAFAIAGDVMVVEPKLNYPDCRDKNPKRSECQGYTHHFGVGAQVSVAIAIGPPPRSRGTLPFVNVAGISLQLYGQAATAFGGTTMVAGGLLFVLSLDRFDSWRR
jgi:hypothetical protein